MRTQTKYLLLIIALVCFTYLSGNNKFKQGLSFRSFEVDKDKRTCLNLTPDKPLKLENGFSMGFDLNLRHYDQNFGYIFRIIANDTLNIDFLINLDSEAGNFMLIVKNREILQFKNNEIGSKIENVWINAAFSINTKNDSISLSLNGIKKTVEYVFNDIDQFQIFFGGNAHDTFSTTDIAPVTIKDIYIYNSKSNLIRYWELDAHGSDNFVYDECKNAKAEVINPQWEIDNHTHWRECASLTFPGSFYCTTFDPVNDRIFIVKEGYVFIYNGGNQSVDTIEVQKGSPFYTEFNYNQLIYDPLKNELISYRFNSNHLAIFSFLTREWTNLDKSLVPSHYTHHSNYYLPDDSLLITFGGYGFHRYNSILHTYDFARGSWEEVNLSTQIPPRYLGSMGYLGDREILYFGGFGNETGLQAEFPRNYYDLFSIRIDNAEVHKEWELPNPPDHFTNSNSMIIDRNSHKFYTLSYPNKRYASVIKLHEYCLDKPEYRVVGDSIPYYFNDTDSYCNLYLRSDGTELYAFTSYQKNGVTEIYIYSIAFPPLSLEEVIQKKPSQANTWIWLAPILSLSLVGGFLLYRVWQNKKRRKEDIRFDLLLENEEDSIVYDRILTEKKPSSVNLLRNFMVIDSSGNDITKNFTPTTTQLFLLLLLSTIKNGHGVTSQELRKTLWFDKSDESARNNRNVYINKLRSILKSFEGIKVVNNNNNWSIRYDQMVFCDYGKVMTLINMLQTGERFNVKLLNELVDVALKGKLLPYIEETEWIESYQSEFTNQLIKCLLDYSKRDEVKTNMLLLLKIADVILLHDNIDEDAIKLKCYALFRSGRKTQALQAFNKFTADYENLLAAKHNLVFEEII